MLSAVSCDIYNVTAHRACRRELARTSAVENNVADSITADHYTVVNIVDIGKLAVLFNGAGADEYRNIAFRKPFGIAEQFYNAAVFFGCCNVFKRYIAYALCIYLVGLDRFAECKVGKNTYFSASIFARREYLRERYLSPPSIPAYAPHSVRSFRGSSAFWSR